MVGRQGKEGGREGGREGGLADLELRDEVGDGVVQPEQAFINTDQGGGSGDWLRLGEEAEDVIGVVIARILLQYNLAVPVGGREGVREGGLAWIARRGGRCDGNCP